MQQQNNKDTTSTPLTQKRSNLRWICISMGHGKQSSTMVLAGLHLPTTEQATGFITEAGIQGGAVQVDPDWRKASQHDVTEPGKVHAHKVVSRHSIPVVQGDSNLVTQIGQEHREHQLLIPHWRVRFFHHGGLELVASKLHLDVPIALADCQQGHKVNEHAHNDGVATTKNGREGRGSHKRK